MSQAKTAHAKVRWAIQQGILCCPDICELCGLHTIEYKKAWAAVGLNRRSPIVGHHYNGYDHPLDVWWVCVRCNRALRDKHDGSLTKAQAQIFAAQFNEHCLHSPWCYRPQVES